MGAVRLAWAHPVGAQVITRLLTLIRSTLNERILATTISLDYVNSESKKCNIMFGSCLLLSEWP